MIFAGLGLCALLMMFSVQEVNATKMIMIDSGSDKGTLYGNSEGTLFCCRSGTNDCSASSC